MRSQAFAPNVGGKSIGGGINMKKDKALLVNQPISMRIKYWVSLVVTAIIT